MLTSGQPLVMSVKTDEYELDKNGNYKTDFNYKSKIHIPSLVFIIFSHLAGFYGFYLIFYSHIATFIYAVWLFVLSVIGVSVGAHRFYSHKSFKTKSTGVRLALVGLHTLSGQLPLYSWVRDHRLHHRYAETDADPINPKRSFVYAHIGWFVCRRHPLACLKGREIDMTDLRMDKIVMFEKKYYFYVYLTLAAVTLAVPMYFWDETFSNALFVCLFARTVYSVNIVLFINSWAHASGEKPFDKTLPGHYSALLSFLTGGDGDHNYHHCFPWDYKGGESSANALSKVIELLARFGLAYDLKAASVDMVKSRATKRGDGSHKLYGREGIEEETAKASIGVFVLQ